MTETLILLAAAAGMLAGVLLTFIPIIPGTVIVWGVGIVAAVALGFTRITPAAALAMSAVMLVSETRELWLPVFGVQVGGIGCRTSLGALFGGLIGAIVIPVPVLNALLGTVLGAVLVEALVVRERGRPLRAGGTAAALFAVGYIIEIVSVFVIVAIFLVSVAATQ